jgi:hypothetical protein
MTNIFSTSVYTGLFAYLFERNWHYFVVGIAVLAIFGLYYHIQVHDSHTGNTLKDVHGVDLDKISILLSRFYLASVFLIMGGLHGAFNFVPTGTVETSPQAEAFVSGLIGTGYLLPAVKTIELIVGVTFLFGIWMPMTLLIAAPIVLNIGLYHLFLDWSGLPIALLMGAAMLYLTHRYRSYFRPLFDMKAEVSPFSITKKESEEIHQIIDGEDISTQNLPHLDSDKMAKKAFVLVAGLCISFMGAAAMILSSDDDKPGTKVRGIVINE